ncbi:lipase [Tritrichomonas foetus]|uniref:sn-1-specific diacylglycerol lipase n=1 Tax=Tritrichomonas foetus TaxID=1144522 RepID=A0A1J4JDB2_9EUKA|nr:lipase [Tritrichomonas foetus]|eukprot:OHS95667.1 lipase [Tritrichomonas foetus]
MFQKAKPVLKKVIGENPESISSLSFAFLFKSIFAALPPPEPLSVVDHTPEEVRTLFNCCFLSKMVYVAPSEREMPDFLSNIIEESQESSLYLIPYFIVNSDKLNRIFLTCRGSYCFNDFIVDFNAGSMEFYGGQVHQGVFLTAQNLYHRIKPLLMKLSEDYRNQADNKRRPITITGHSLGAGVAATLCEMFYYDAPDLDVNCVIFAPCASFCKKLWQESLPRIRSYVLDGDFVPFLSFHNATELPREVIPEIMKKYLDSAIKKRMGMRHYNPPMVPIDSNPFKQPPPSIDMILNDDIDSYLKPIPLYPPGDCFLVALQDPLTGTIHLKKVKDCDYFGHFINDLNEFRHMMGIYREWIEKYVDDYFTLHSEYQKFL